MEAILGLLGICGANCAVDRDENKSRAGEVVRVGSSGLFELCCILTTLTVSVSSTVFVITACNWVVLYTCGAVEGRCNTRHALHPRTCDVLRSCLFVHVMERVPIRNFSLMKMQCIPALLAFEPSIACLCGLYALLFRERAILSAVLNFDCPEEHAAAYCSPLLSRADHA